MAMSALKDEVSVEKPTENNVQVPGSSGQTPPAKHSMTENNEENKVIRQKQPQQSATKKSPKDFIFGKLIGEGSFSTVYLAKDVHTNNEYAIKVCDKNFIIREKKQEAILRERNIMNILNNHPSPFFIKFYCSFQDKDKLYFVMNYAKCGDLLSYIIKVGSFDEVCTRFYAGELLLALEHLHKLGIIHRDLKPENILLTEHMHIQVTDFGSATVINKDGPEDAQNRRNSFVGTAQYVSPELFENKTVSFSCDLWALGCIIYQMVSGMPPFSGPNEFLIFKKIQSLEYEFPDGFLPRAQNLIEKLLVLDPKKRLGATDADGYPSIRNHEFFKNMNWESLHLQTPPRILPYLPGISGSEELRSQYEVPDDLEPGLDDKQMTRLLGLALQEEEESISKPVKNRSILDIPPDEFKRRLGLQAQSNPWHQFVENNLILKQGLVDKRKRCFHVPGSPEPPGHQHTEQMGLFSRRRMLLLTTGPHLYYVDPQNLVLKGEIPWCPELRPEIKNFKTFFVHTPKRTYYLEDPENHAGDWCKAIDEVRKATYSSQS